MKFGLFFFRKRRKIGGQRKPAALLRFADERPALCQWVQRQFLGRGQGFPARAGLALWHCHGARPGGRAGIVGAGHRSFSPRRQQGAGCHAHLYQHLATHRCEHAQERQSQHEGWQGRGSVG